MKKIFNNYFFLNPTNNNKKKLKLRNKRVKHI